MDGSTTITWPGVAGISYTVEFSQTLNGDWTTLTPAPIAGTGQDLTFDAPAETPNGFYRVKTAN